MDNHSQTRHHSLACLLLIFITLVTFWRVRDCEFISIDDFDYILSNPHIQNGLTWESIQWAFCADLFFDSPRADYWQPVTLLSRMLDIQLFGLNPSMHHLINLMFHVLNALLLFHVLWRMTGALERSALVAALFAVHPLHVESVAWVIERKDMLSGFFWMLTIWAYLRYVEFSRWGRYGWVVLTFGLELMSKPMGVTLPFVLLLLDYWPLKRFQIFDCKSPGSTIRDPRSVMKGRQLILEKLPLFVLSMISSVVTFYAKGSYLHHDSAIVGIESALISYATYLLKSIFPYPLAVYYPRPINGFPFWQVFGAGLILIWISGWVTRWGRQRSYLFVGWWWFVGTLIPVIGLNDIAGADRFTYLPLVGIFIMAVWGISELGTWIAERPNSLTPYLLRGVRAFRCLIFRISAGVVLIILMIGSMFQLRHWRSSVTLAQYALQVTSNNHIAHYCLGTDLLEKGRTEEAIEHYQQALQIKPDFTNAHNNLGTALGFQKRWDEAMIHYQMAVQLQPDYPEAHYNLGNCLMRQNKLDKAEAHFEIVLKLQAEPFTTDLAQKAINKLRLRHEHPIPPPKTQKTPPK